MNTREEVPEAWPAAFTLAERAERIRTGFPSASPSPEDLERAQWRLDSWRRQSPFDQPGRMAARLAQFGLDAGSFERLLRTPPAALDARTAEAPAWAREILLAEWGGDDASPWQAGSEDSDPTSGFLNLVSPLFRRSMERLRVGLETIAGKGSDAIFRPAVLEKTLLRPMASRLLWMLDRTLALEVNVARVEGRLRGETPQDRFKNFIDSLSRPEVARPLLDEYAVLSRQIVESLGRWEEAVLEMLGRYRDDREAIRASLLGGEDPGELIEVQGGAGDSHQGGRTVAIFRFASGRRLVYKPHSLAVDRQFQVLLAWINARGDHPPFRTLSALDRGRWGWQEWVEADPCRTAAEVGRYHFRLGGLLAVLYALGSTDFHFDNLIAAGEHPVPVDLETLLHPDLPRPDAGRPDERLAGRVLRGSVLRVGLLPFRVGEDEQGAGLDLSGVAAVAGKPSQDRILQWEQSGTDVMHATRERLPMSGGRNRPVLDGREVDVADHIEEMAAGFEALYHLLVREREPLLAPDGPLLPFASVPVRVVLRSTRAYGLILEDSFHPDFLRDALDRDRFFDRMWVGVEEFPAIERFVAAEHRDLWRGDVPYFHTRPDSTDLLASDGTRIERFFPETSLASASRRIRSLGEEDLFRQTWFTRVSLGTLLLNRDKGDWPGFPVTDPGTPAEGKELRGELRGAACRLGEWFDRMAVREGEYVTWVGLDLRNKIWALFPISEDLYAGTPGIALFLAYLGEVSGQERFANLARCGMRALSLRLASVPDQIPSIGMFQGWGGVIYTLAHLGKLWRDESLLAEAEGMIVRVEERVAADSQLDVVSGSAGAVAGLLALHRANGSKRALAAARLCGERLLEKSRPVGEGRAWFTELGGDEAQTGFSHGAAGIALALMELGAVAREERFTEAALAGFDFERGALWPEMDRWIRDGSPRKIPGKRMSAAEKALGVSWCYGAPGAGIARARALRHGENPALREELDRAIRLTLEHGFGKNHSLCHGDLGNLDLLLLDPRAASHPSLEAEKLRLTRAVLSSVERDGWICGTVAGIEAPGLMNGLAGIGYGLIRLADPDRVPSVLALDPPPDLP